MLIIEYCKDGDSYSDFDLERQAKIMYLKYLYNKNNLYNLDEMRIKVSSENIITCIRTLIAEGSINHEFVLIEMNGKKTGIDDTGMEIDRIKELGEINMNMLFRMINIRGKKAKNE